ncbi:nuclear transport factor 2 family protein [Mycolicibacterium diernhoferi]|uniref:DUF4440 domain-containing protein n=1 Tax=Mycolicibacterium diernhoferi TaxID=1801 RepID=A0A1Q4H483_9MYCO|nr:nuclear transport factor 2 family protein [Mycolicibacterium diernhoferi]OJZ61989.1 DUF4440 domain-containing protein [Mycolicibacterium diernhoferi]OPE54327.1 DUF4440 domain-containing protein [Mycolicibacterium diernhoferi]PEG51741.1 DUF4440 domain-containing protein [Mycolicibacterium diernhoferi]QYL23473.1 nuclear transport factor 2 family protein [Mycolicibacterium diernhoferi]
MKADPPDLPEAVTTYLNAPDTATALTAFTADATVTDEGRDHHGTEEIRAWMTRAASEYTYTTEFLGVAGDLDIVQRLEGNFPGGVVDLHYRFTMAGPLIARLVIEP